MEKKVVIPRSKWVRNSLVDFSYCSDGHRCALGHAASQLMNMDDIEIGNLTTTEITRKLEAFLGCPGHALSDIPVINDGYSSNRETMLIEEFKQAGVDCTFID